MRGRQVFRGRVGIDAERQPIEQRRGARTHRGVIEPPVPADLAAREDVARHGQVGKAQHLLVDHADAVLDGLTRTRVIETPAVPADVARVGRDQAGQDLEQRRLAGAVLAHQRVRAAGGHLERDAAQRVDGAKRLANAAELQTHRADGSLRRT
jgi:hypothetical protein